MNKNEKKDPEEIKEEIKNDLNFIEEFIEQKKSQNRILKGMIEKLNQEIKPAKAKKRKTNPSAEKYEE